MSDVELPGLKREKQAGQHQPPTTSLLSEGWSAKWKFGEEEEVSGLSCQADYSARLQSHARNGAVFQVNRAVFVQRDCARDTNAFSSNSYI